MITFAGYYNQEEIENSVADQDFFVHGCGRYQLLNRRSFSTRRPNGAKNYQLLYVADGTAHFQLQGKLEKISKGSAILYHPGEPQYYYYLAEEKPDVYWVHFTCKQDNSFFQKVGLDESNLYRAGLHQAYLKLFDKIIQELQRKDIYFEDTASLMLQELLLLMYRNRIHDGDSALPYNRQLEETIRYFNMHLDQTINLKQYTKDINQNYYRFIDMFTKYMGISPKQYLIKMRMSKARELLSNSTYPIAEISDLVGYDNPLYFSRLFKKATGMSPSQYRNKVAE